MVGQIRIDNVQKKFINPDGSEVVALNDLSFTVKPGSFVSLIGPFRMRKNHTVKSHRRPESS